MSAASAVPEERLREHLAVRRLARQAPPSEGLTVRTAYANLFAVLGQRCTREHLQRLARQSRRVLWRTQLELENPVPWPGFAFRGLDHLRRALSGGRGACVVSFHVGPYRFIPIELAQLGERVSIVVDERGLQRETAQIAKHAELCAAAARDSHGRLGYWRADLLERLDVINAEAPDVALRMVKALRQGRLVVVYLDGNTGSGPRKSEHARSLPFLGTRILVRPGVGEIAQLTGSPVLTVLAHRRPQRQHACRFFPALCARPGEDRQAFSERVLASALGRLEVLLARRPGLWEEWHHFHRMQDPDHVRPGSSGALAGPSEARFVVDDYRAFAVSHGSQHLVFEPEQRRYVRVSDLGGRLMQALRQPRSLAELAHLAGPGTALETVAAELERLDTRHWLERRP